MTDFVSTPDSELHRKFNLVEDVRDWKATWAKADLLASGPDKALIQKITYRPFDPRFTYNTQNSRGFIGWPVPKVMKHLTGGNISLITARTNKSPAPDHFFVSELPSETKAGESTVQSYNFPLRLMAEGRTENLSSPFRDYLDARYGEHYDPEQILGYIYAVLHAPTYRSRYAEFLRIDFPRILFAETPEQFEALSALGWDLIQTHLLKTVPRSSPRLGDYVGKGDHTVEAVIYSPEEATVWINPKRTQGFANIPQAVWDFHIGGYQVIDKYLKSRKGRTLNLDEQGHVGEIAESLNFTIAQMAKIDAAYLAAFPEQAGG